AQVVADIVANARHQPPSVAIAVRGAAVTLTPQQANTIAIVLYELLLAMIPLEPNGTPIPIEIEIAEAPPDVLAIVIGPITPALTETVNQLAELVTEDLLGRILRDDSNRRLTIAFPLRPASPVPWMPTPVVRMRDRSV
ncbi:MAG: hypothetical protein NZ518_11825, partial [Dehalococcoidia bacterium]|nr:hypothetical protein [Dehalococcoidia bacterium]